MPLDFAQNDNPACSAKREELRHLIRALEGGEAEADSSPARLDEVRPERLADIAAASLWALAPHIAGGKPILWVGEYHRIMDEGLPYGPGLQQAGVTPVRFILVRARRAIDALWAMEEGLRSGAVGLVVGEVADMDLTASRRLSLAARESGVPCMVLGPAGGAGAPAAFSRVQVSAAARDADDDLKPYLAARLEKHRGGEPPATSFMEWNDATHSFAMVAPLAGGTLAASGWHLASA
ncbi:ImuA family protein [Pseudokordiimonas caeni]|uniref:ImuA family protein n=1 Tax=Pseudokordiimonas caeni TaxID=2997908 RepID=UPI00281205AB|nr:hypothetical protein [Pseudokordiimonas caeni]